MRSMRRGVFIFSFVLGLGGFASAHRAVGGEFVVVSATAAPEYRRTKGPDGIMAESYVFSPGLHFLGATRDKTQEQATFLAVAQALAAGLARQKYFPAEDPARANLVIVVHWGATETYEDPNRQSDLEAMNRELTDYIAKIEANGMAAGGPINDLLSQREAATTRQEQYVNANAELLGFKRSLLRESVNSVASEEEKTMRLELAEERYFVVLMAYDYQLLKTQKKPRLLWVTRMSMRSLGKNFTEAVPSLTRVAADFFGQGRDDITRVETKLREGQVEIGELRVIDPVALPAGATPATAPK